MFSAELKTWSFLRSPPLVEGREGGLLEALSSVYVTEGWLVVKGSFGHSPAMQACGRLVNPKPLGLTKPPQNVLPLAQRLLQFRFSIITAGIYGKKIKRKPKKHPTQSCQTPFHPLSKELACPQPTLYFLS